MKTKSKNITATALALWAVAIWLSAAENVSAQSFMNLDFEQATVEPAPPGYVPADAYNPISAASALPYWTVMEDTTVCNAVWGSPAALDETSVALVSTGANPIQGSYSVQLSAYADASSPYFRSSSISQTGFVPNGTQSIRFSIESPYPTSGIQANPIVILNGTPISLSAVSQSGNVITMAGDVSAFAGTTAALVFSCSATQGAGFPGNENYFNLDSIQFSPSSVPEPSAFAFAFFGGLVIYLRRSVACRH